MKKFIEVVRAVRLGYPLLWSSTKRNRRIEVVYRMDYGVLKANLLK